MRVFAALLILLASESITAAEEPCRAEGDRVSCEREAFDKLTKKIIDARAERDVLKVKLDACLAQPVPEPVVVRPSALSKIGPVVLGVLGSGILGISSMMDGASTGRVTLAVVGFLSVGAGLYWAMP